MVSGFGFEFRVQGFGFRVYEGDSKRAPCLLKLRHVPGIVKNC